MQRCQILNKESPFWLSKESLAMMSPSNLHCYCNGERNNVMGETKSKQKNPLNVFWTANKPFSSWYFFSLFRNRSSSNSRQYVRSRQSPKQREKIRKKPLNHDVTLLWALYFCCVPGVSEAPFYLFEVLAVDIQRKVSSAPGCIQLCWEIISTCKTRWKQ